MLVLTLIIDYITMIYDDLVKILKGKIIFECQCHLYFFSRTGRRIATGKMGVILAQ